MNILLFHWNGIMNDIEAELIKRGHTILPVDGTKETAKKADVVVFWNETALAGWREFLTKLKKLKKRTVLVQHGRRGTSRIYPPFNETLISDVVCVWSENDKKRLMSVGVDEKKIVVTGTPIFKNLKPRVKTSGRNVVFSPEHWDKDVLENLIVADELRKLPGKYNLMTKTLKGQQDPTHYPNAIESDRNAANHFDIVSNALSHADVVVAISESTFELMAEMLDIPVVVADVWIPKACDGDDRYKEYHREYSNACTMAKLSELNKAVIRELKNPKRLAKERAQIAIDDGGSNISDPLSRIVNVIEHGNSN